MTNTELKIKYDFFPNPQEIYKLITTTPDGAMWVHNGMSIIASIESKADGREWLHVSCARRSRLPTYEELLRVKNEFIGKDRKAVFIFPEEKNYVNINKNCLHLWYTAENPLPEFSDILPGFGRSI